MSIENRLRALEAALAPAMPLCRCNIPTPGPMTGEGVDTKMLCGVCCEVWPTGWSLGFHWRTGEAVITRRDESEAIQ